MFRSSLEATPVEMAKGITRRTLTHGKLMLLVEFTIGAGAVFPEHAHPYEQIGYLCDGAGRLWIGEEMRMLTSGTSWCIPAGVPHRAEFTEDSVALDVFSPVREDYLDTIHNKKPE
jgi:quercetin dioxygenase-like cupin family protein